MHDDPLIIAPRRKGDDGYRVFSIRVKEQTVERIDAIAAKTGRSRNELIGRFLEYAVERCIVEPDTP